MDEGEQKGQMIGVEKREEAIKVGDKMPKTFVKWTCRVSHKGCLQQLSCVEKKLTNGKDPNFWYRYPGSTIFYRIRTRCNILTSNEQNPVSETSLIRSAV